VKGIGLRVPEIHLGKHAEKHWQPCHHLAKRRPRELHKQDDHQQGNRHHEKVEPAPAEITAEAKAQEAGHQHKIFEIGKEANLGGNPTNQQELKKQAQHTDQGKLAVGKSSQGFRVQLPLLDPAPAEREYESAPTIVKIQIDIGKDAQNQKKQQR